jgi:hypothetical protein
MNVLPYVNARPVAFATLLVVVAMAACSSGSNTSKPVTTSPAGNATVAAGKTTVTAGQATAAPVENSPAGDIPDTQAFVAYHSTAGGYTLQVPEGWARTESGPNAAFDNKLQSIHVDVTSVAAAPTVDTVSANEVPQLTQQTQAFEQVDLKAVTLAGGPAVLLRYRVNSAPDSVTGKTTRLEVDRYELFKNGKMAAISLSAPAGSDNVDIWNQISGSFAWD